MHCEHCPFATKNALGAVILHMMSKNLDALGNQSRGDHFVWFGVKELVLPEKRYWCFTFIDQNGVRFDTIIAHKLLKGVSLVLNITTRGFFPVILVQFG
jgi:hypothetical protein